MTAPVQVDAPRFAAIAMRALERMAFAMLEPAGDDGAAVLGAAEHRAWIEIGGHGGGFVLVGVESGLVRELCANMLGRDPVAVDPRQHGDATAMELANVLAGELIMAQGGAELPFRLELPQPASAADVARVLARRGGRAVGCVLACSAGRLAVLFELGPR